MEFIVRPYESRFGNHLHDLHNGIWVFPSLEKDPRLQRLIELGKAVMVFDEEKAVGYGTYTLLGEADEEFQRDIRNHLHHSRNPQEREAFKRYLEENQRRIGKGEIVLDYFDPRKNPFLDADLQVNDNDFIIHQVGVNPRYRNKGVGTGICKSLKGIAGEKKSPTMYLESTSVAQEFFEKKGYVPFFRFGPYFSNRSPTTLMGMILS